MAPLDHDESPVQPVSIDGSDASRVSPNPRKLARQTLWALFYTIAVVLWGAFVRASHSGDGCGPNWPFCEGQGMKTFIEFAHRMSSGLTLVIWGYLIYQAYKLFPKGTQGRSAAFGVAFFLVTESLVGALLVLKSLVAYNPAGARIGWMSVHLLNTFTLIGFMGALFWHFSGRPAIRLRQHKEIGYAAIFCVVAVALLGVSGALTALADTIFQTSTSAEAFRRASASDAHFLERVRLWHPMIAVIIGVMLFSFGQVFIHKRQDVPEVKTWVHWMVGIYAIEMVLGLVNVKLGIPPWMQMVHLLAADALWLAVLGVAFTSLQTDRTQLVDDQAPEAISAPEPELVGAQQKVTWKAYLALTKPRVISLLLFTTMLAMFIAKGGFPGWGLFFAVLIGGYAAAGAANTINMVIDRDIDIKMERTAKRPTVTHLISGRNAMLFAGAQIVLSVALLAGVANWLSAWMAMAGLLFYVFIYTLGLKRRTAQNIVIGGAAGSFPPLVGYAAVTNHLSPLAWVLFAIIFVWTPVHFWALALLIKDEYAAVGVPMLPVVKGDRVTVIQIGIYTILTCVVSMIPLWQGEARTFYLVGSMILNLCLLVFSAQLYRRPERPQALKVFKFSMIYLALLFVVIAIDRARWM